MGGRLSALRVNVKAETEGVWMAYEDGIELKIAGSSNPRYQEGIQKITARRGFRKKTMKILDNPKVKALVARHILKDWRGLLDDDDNEIPFSPEAALEIFNDPAYRPFYMDVCMMAGEEDEYREGSMKESEGN